MDARSSPAATGLLTLVLGLMGGSGCSMPPEAAATPRKMVVQTSSAGSFEARAAAGLALELTHWLQYNAAVIARSPSLTVGSPADGRAGDDIEDILWVDVKANGTLVSLRWDVVDAATTRMPDFTAHEPVREPLPRLPGAVAERVARELGTGRAGAKVSSRVAEDADAYAAFLRVLGTPMAVQDEREALRTKVELLEALRSRLPGYPPLAYALGSAYLDLAGLVGGQAPYYELAERELDRAFALDPADPAVRAKRASFLAKLGRTEESVQLLVDGLADYPHFPSFHNTLGYVFRYAGLMHESMGSYRRSQELDSSTENLVSAQDQITKSLIYLGDYDAALASHRRMLGFSEAAGRAVDEKQWFYEGVIHLYREDVASAIHAFRAGRQLDAESVWTTFGRAYEGMALGDTATVEAVLTELEGRDVVDGERHYRLVHFSAFVGNVDRAVDHLRQSTDSGFFNASYLATDPWTAVIRGEPETEIMIEAARGREEAIEKILEE